jgi:hypothetical protein
MKKNAEALRVEAHVRMARKLGVIASLTLEEWEQTISDFGGICAYCRVKPFTVLEHFVPVAIAGTHSKNCLPACKDCNIKKRNRQGDKLVEVFGQERIDSLQAYLQSRTIVPAIERPLSLPKKPKREPKVIANPRRPIKNFDIDKEYYSIEDYSLTPTNMLYSGQRADEPQAIGSFFAFWSM